MGSQVDTTDNSVASPIPRDEHGHPCLPTWSAYNSTISTPAGKTNVGVIAPLITTPSTQWPGLYTDLMRAQHISVTVVRPDLPTVITLNLQLYEKAQKLMSRPDMKGKFALRIEELHTVFSALKVLGHYIEGNGIDQAWTEAGMYSPTMVRQALEGKHLHRAIETHTVALVTLYGPLLIEFWNEHPQEKLLIDEHVAAMNQSFETGDQKDSEISY